MPTPPSDDSLTVHQTPRALVVLWISINTSDLSCSIHDMTTNLTASLGVAMVGTTVAFNHKKCFIGPDLDPRGCTLPEPKIVWVTLASKQLSEFIRSRSIMAAEYLDAPPVRSESSMCVHLFASFNWVLKGNASNFSFVRRSSYRIRFPKSV